MIAIKFQLWFFVNFYYFIRPDNAPCTKEAEENSEQKDTGNLNIYIHYYMTNMFKFLNT